VLFDGAPVRGRVPVSGADGSAQQRPQRRTTGGHQEARVRRQEAQVPAGQGAEGVHHAGHHHERVHRVLVAVFRAGAGQAVPQRPVQHTRLAEQPVPVAGLRQLAAEPRECLMNELLLLLLLLIPHRGKRFRRRRYTISFYS